MAADTLFLHILHIPRAAKVQGNKKIILFILKILLILSYWNIATSVQTKPQLVGLRRSFAGWWAQPTLRI